MILFYLYNLYNKHAVKYVSCKYVCVCACVRTISKIDREREGGERERGRREMEKKRRGDAENVKRGKSR